MVQIEIGSWAIQISQFYNLQYLIEKNEMGDACGAYGGGERCAQVSGGET